MENLKEKAYKLMLQNRRSTLGYQYTLPSPDFYPYQWFWDSCFHAIILSHFNTQDAKKELLSLLFWQFPDGMIPHMIYWERNKRGKFPVVRWGTKHTSSITQPSFIAYAAWQIYQKDHDISFLRAIYRSLERYFHYVLTSRDPYFEHMISIINPDESGEDNSPRFDSALGLPVRHSAKTHWSKRLSLVRENKRVHFDVPFGMRDFFWVRDVPINAILVKELSIMSRIAKCVGHHLDSKFYKSQSDIIAGSMKMHMVQDDIFWSIYLPLLNPEETKEFDLPFKKIRVKTWHIFAPLFAEILTKKQARALIHKYLLNTKEFSLPYLVPTVSRSDPAFDPTGFWRGPVWVNINWIICKGLKAYGFELEAQCILESTVNLLEENGFREYFNPVTGEGLGADNFTWGGLVIDMLEG